jgi:nucleoside-diphosphate-sugar epimerase
MALDDDVLGVANLSGLVKYGHGYDRLYRPNVQTVQNLAAECAARQLLFIHFSGTAVHGNGLQSAVTECDRVRPVEAYGQSKAESERVIFREVEARGLRAIIFRSTVPVGPDLHVSELNKMYDTVVTAPIVPAIKGSNNTYISNEDVGRTFVYSMENRDAVAARDPKTVCDLVYNLGASRPLSDAQVIAHLQESIFGKVKKPIVEVPPAAAMAIGYLSTFVAQCQHVVLRRDVDPTLHYELARLFRGWHCQDQTRFTNVFGARGFALKHDEPERVLDVGTVYKFLTDWAERPKPPRIAQLAESFVAERTRVAYD